MSLPQMRNLWCTIELSPGQAIFSSPYLKYDREQLPLSTSRHLVVDFARLHGPIEPVSFYPGYTARPTVFTVNTDRDDDVSTTASFQDCLEETEEEVLTTEDEVSTSEVSETEDEVEEDRQVHFTGDEPEVKTFLVESAFPTRITSKQSRPEIPIPGNEDDRPAAPKRRPTPRAVPKAEGQENRRARARRIREKMLQKLKADKKANTNPRKVPRKVS